MILFLNISNHALFAYYLLSNVIYLGLLVVALLTSAAHHRRLKTVHLGGLKDSPFTKPLTLIIPAHNEERSIVASTGSLLRLDYPEFQIVVVNDGSSDATLDELRRHYHLRPANQLYVSQLSSAPVRALFRSPVEPRLLVIDKECGGSKADAVNAGINAASSPYICVVDADSILERDALLRIMNRVMDEPERVVAVGGIVRALNGSIVEEGQLRRVRLPRGTLEIIQVIEYLRAFLIGREGWASMNLLTIISGAFGVFRKDLVMRVGGYRPKSIGEDFDLVVRMHRKLCEENVDYRISFVPDPVCWTEVPRDYLSLARQRARWQKGLLDTLWLNRDALFRAPYGRFGWIALPYMWFFELFAPAMEIFGYATIILAAWFGVLSRQFFLEFLLFGYAFATMISMGAVLQEEVTYRRYNDWRDVARLISFCFLEHFPYRQLHMVWRLQGMWQFLRGDLIWKPIKRSGLTIDSAHSS